ncbi:hypothetical protein ERICIV_01780 [Paenibacillus larvae subsp. larvae]|jgi:stage II sporulation protein M|uniref:Stage II sporulation protein M n=1 Tax=Paenibacillus larvae subsp. larvae TaxID=147375 RepID=A0A2L1UCQ9_9BACL|nr:stage II sporulation protein M [Paenibacillus larvae]AQT86370.1 hypothetical protein B1222_21305 [Paenibacillus larvae subsp. pulvifaciens]AQZ48021.1 hypothetical protein B5S25_16940 [Paenibacillus larvae subsp. pulvifaciens]AVF25937.1 hypothetical protein ERICIII_01759 [Paenibacillus larvae subsp. larvae]AVF30714.1 hypothetical protein ERICIV_01780 [Paenibacillus larvae subsp. larvae]MBH0341076.1 hypothetical protein [Paenibacillus larvae]
MMGQLLVRWRRLFLLSVAFYATGIIIGVLSVSFIDDPSFTPNESNTWDVFRNNVAVGMLIIISGLITGGILSSLIMIVNGYIIGFTIIGVISSNGIKPIMEGLFPHFLPESIAFLLCSTMGFGFGKYFLSYLIGIEHSKAEVKGALKDYMVMSVLFILLLLIASIIEANISTVMIKADS